MKILLKVLRGGYFFTHTIEMYICAHYSYTCYQYIAAYIACCSNRYVGTIIRDSFALHRQDKHTKTCAAKSYCATFNWILFVSVYSITVKLSHEWNRYFRRSTTVGAIKGLLHGNHSGTGSSVESLNRGNVILHVCEVRTTCITKTNSKGALNNVKKNLKLFVL